MTGSPNSRMWLSSLRSIVFAKPDSSSTRTRMWPTLGEIALVATVALVVTATDVHISAQIGLLTHPPYYDGVSYELQAKSLYYRLNLWWTNSLSLTELVRILVRGNSTLWVLLVALNFMLLGEGEWQAYAARFWPTFFLLLLVFWIVRSRAGYRQAYIAVVFTSLLPTISVGLRSSLWECLVGRVNLGTDWYLSDLRPNLLFAVLLVWSIVPVLENLDALDRRAWLVSGTFAGLAVLAKPTTSPILLFAWSLTIIYVLVINRRRALTAISGSLWGVLAFAILVSPIVLSGAARRIFDYIYKNAVGVQRVLWSNPNPTFLSETTYYWNWFQFHMGRVEGWIVLGIGLALSVVAVRKGIERGHRRIIGYLALSAALYGLLAALPLKDYFQGLPYYLLLWVFSWTVLTPFLQKSMNRKRVVSCIMILLVSTYATAVVLGGLYATQNWPVEEQHVGLQNREVVIQIAYDLDTILTVNDRFMYVPLWGSPNTLQFYMMDEQGQYPQTVWIDLTKSPEQFIRESVSTCKAVLVYEQDIEEVALFHWTHPLTFPYYRAIAEWVTRPESSYVLFKTYHFQTAPNTHELGHANLKDFTLWLYVREPAAEMGPSYDRWNTSSGRLFDGNSRYSIKMYGVNGNANWSELREPVPDSQSSLKIEPRCMDALPRILKGSLP